MTISSEQRRLIRERAGGCCEYCHVAEDERLSRFQIDHIIPLKHNGKDEIDNLCLACLKCNGYKGPNAAALDPDSGEATRFYDPRRQRWEEHFQVNADASITGLTPEGRATILVLRMNERSRIQSRQLSMALGDYPCKREQSPSP